MKGSKWWLIGLVLLGVVLVLLLVSRSDYEALRADYDALGQQSSDLSTELQQARSDLTQLRTDYNAAKKELTKIQADYDDLNTDYEAVSQELAEIQKVYPPRDFSSVLELENWLRSNDVSEQPWARTYEGWYAKALQVQEDALRDGYIISVQYHFCDESQIITYVACVAVINGYLWMWDPETDQPFPDYVFGKVK